MTPFCALPGPVNRTASCECTEVVLIDFLCSPRSHCVEVLTHTLRFLYLGCFLSFRLKDWSHEEHVLLSVVSHKLMLVDLPNTSFCFFSPTFWAAYLVPFHLFVFVFIFLYWIIDSLHCCQVILLCYFYLIKICWDFLFGIISMRSIFVKNLWALKDSGLALCIWNMQNWLIVLFRSSISLLCFFFPFVFLNSWYILYWERWVTASSYYWTSICYGFCFVEVPTVIGCINIPGTHEAKFTRVNL